MNTLQALLLVAAGLSVGECDLTEARSSVPAEAVKKTNLNSDCVFCLLCFSPGLGLQGTQPVQTDDPVRDARQQSSF